jgi:protein gp37
MGTTTAIEWTDHTWNPWRGCTHVSAGCAHCYAAAFAARNPAILGHWGSDASRVLAPDEYWTLPARWEKAAKNSRTRPHVFCGSLMDVFDDWPGQLANIHGEPLWFSRYDPDVQPLARPPAPERFEPPDFQPYTLTQARGRLWRTIAATPQLDWQLLTKRPQHWRNSWPLWPRPPYTHIMRIPTMHPNAPNERNFATLRNVWIGVSVENQDAAEARIPILLAIPAAARFLSCEPLLGPIDLAATFHRWYQTPPGTTPATLPRLKDWIHWVIAGGESGPHARPMYPNWVRSLRDQCGAYDIPFFFKQWGEWAPVRPPDPAAAPARVVFSDGRSCEFSQQAMCEEAARSGIAHGRCHPVLMYRVGKKAAGRTLDGRLWNQYTTHHLKEEPQ